MKILERCKFNQSCVTKEVNLCLKGNLGRECQIEAPSSGFLDVELRYVKCWVGS